MKTVIQIAKREVGTKEKPNNIVKYNAYFNGTDFYNGSKGDGKTWGVEWCDCFNDYCFCEAYGIEKAKKMLYQGNKSCGAGCKFSADYYRAHGAFIKRGEGTPREGDQIFFGSYGNEQHTGLVEKVENSRVYTIEGNCDNMVKEKSYSLTYNRISGYGRPDYSIVEAEVPVPAPTPAPAPTKSIDELAHEVLDGKWGNGTERKTRLESAGYNYNAVQKRVNELLKPSTPAAKPSKPTTSTAGKYKVTAKSGLNVRHGPGTTYPKVSRYGLGYGETVIVDHKINGWYHVTGRLNGYVSGAYLQKI